MSVFLNPRLISLVMALFLAKILCAQQVSHPIVYSGKLLDSISTLQDEEKYRDALKMCYRISESDTNYHEVLYQLAYIHMLDKKYDSSVHYAKKAAVLFPERKGEYLHIAASSYDYADSTASALRLLDELIAAYPSSPRYYYSKGIILKEQNKTVEAREQYQKALLLNPFYTSPHFSLGESYYQQGNFVAAFIAFQTYLLLEPEGRYVGPAIKYLSSLSTITDDVRNLAEKASFEEYPSFEQIQQVLLSGAALSKKYQLKVSLDDPIIRQLQALNELLKYDESNQGFMMQYYIPFYQNVFKQNFDALVFVMLSGVDIKEINAWLKKNDKKVKAFATDAYQYFQTIRITREPLFSKRAACTTCYLWQDDVFTGVGPCKNQDLSQYSGTWKFYHKNGVLASEGAFNSNQEREGAWKFYYNNGVLKEESSYVNGKAEGLLTVYFKNGKKQIEYTVKNGLQQGEEKNYFFNGMVRSELTYKDDKKDGVEKEYNYKGAKTAEAAYVKGELDGLIRTFHENGKAKDTLQYKMGKAEGPFSRYDPNGKLIEQGSFANGLRQGWWSKWYNDGTLMEKTQYVDGEITGEFFEYHKNGKLSRKGRYFKGKNDGLVEDYDEEGRRFSVIEMDKGKVRQISFFDKAGNTIETFTTSKGNIEVTFFDANGVKTSTGTFSKDGTRMGTFTDFYPSGKVREVKEYKDGMLEGLVTGYYTNGKKKYETQYKQDEMNGFNIWYHTNGSKSSEGWYESGVKQQYVTFYDEKGRITDKSYFLDGDLHGYKYQYFPNGVPQFKERYERDWVMEVWQYDSTGRELRYFDLRKGDGEVNFVSTDGKPYINKRIKNYMDQGAYVFKYPDGSNMIVRTFKDDMLHGPAQWFFATGKLQVEGEYAYGKKEGVWKEYFAGGRLLDEDNYQDGELHGLGKRYRPDGTLERTDTYVEGTREGPNAFYGFNGEILVQINYHKGEPVSYTYPDATGKLKTPVLLKKNSGMVTAYFPNGKQSASFTFRDGDLQGAFKLFFPDGTEMVNATYDAGRLTGLRTMYYPGGKIMKQEHFIAGEQYGPSVVYYPNGNIMSSEELYNGSRHGEVKYYQENGTLVSSYLFYHGDPEKKLK